MKTLFKFVSIVAIAILSGCANRPGSIRASYVSHEKFSDLSCEQLVNRQLTTHIKLERLSREQDGKANGDAIGVFLLGIPFSKLSGDHEAEIAHLKGELEALETAQVKAKCSSNQTTSNTQTRVQELKIIESSSPKNPYTRCVPHLNGSLGGCP